MRNLLVFNFFQKCLATPVVRLFFVRFCFPPENFSPGLRTGRADRHAEKHPDIALQAQE